MITTDKINECIKMLKVIKQQSKNIPSVRNKVVIDDVSKKSLDFVIDKTIEILEEV